VSTEKRVTVGDCGTGFILSFVVLKWEEESGIFQKEWYNLAA
jgi:hypothetical protein